MVDGLEIKKEDYKLVKTRFSAFFDTNLHTFLQGNGVNNLVVTGVQTPNCIRQTVFDAVSHDYHSVTVISDATAAATSEVHEGSNEEDDGNGDMEHASDMAYGPWMLVNKDKNKIPIGSRGRSKSRKSRRKRMSKSNSKISVRREWRVKQGANLEQNTMQPIFNMENSNMENYNGPRDDMAQTESSVEQNKEQNIEEIGLQINEAQKVTQLDQMENKDKGKDKATDSIESSQPPSSSKIFHLIYGDGPSSSTAGLQHFLRQSSLECQDYRDGSGSQVSEQVAGGKCVGGNREGDLYDLHRKGQLSVERCGEISDGMVGP
ncbi:Isochorismatase-like protein [Corchorus capsularis]|uniref:Isochorismatase-like protein n=1 Tax=Corchorus capsularis TaxID=210143 RepID=A0A1R3HBJ5_COCAP|nr:Isochorismatase-like protein [Corchorus capsularis]